VNTRSATPTIPLTFDLLAALAERMRAYDATPAPERVYFTWPDEPVTEDAAQ